VVMDDGVIFEGGCRMKDIKSSDDEKPESSP